MAKNLRAKIPEGDTLTVFDVNTASTEKLKSESGSSKLEIAKSPKEVAEKSVSLHKHPKLQSQHDEQPISNYMI